MFSFPFFLRRTCLVLAFLTVAGCSDSILQDSWFGGQGGLTTPRPPLPAPRQPAPRPVPLPTLVPPQLQSYSAPTAAPLKAKVALLLPLSGKSAALGQAMVNAAQLAVFDVAPKDFELLPRDTGVTSVQAVEAAKKALADGAQLIVGPLFATDVAAVRPVVRAAGVSMLALSTDVSLAGQGTYVMGFAPAPQVERVVGYAVMRGLRRFAALVPPGPYGELVAQTFKQTVKAYGAELVAVEKTSNLPFLATRKEAIDALLLPFGGEELFRIADDLEKAGFDKEKIKVLGTGLWDDSFIAEGHAFLLGGWYATAEPHARLKFEESYQDTYDVAPPRLATLAYDATALAAVLAKQGRSFDAESLTNPVGFTGLDGLFRLTAPGTIERGLAIGEISSFGVSIIDPAPSRFGGK